MIPFQKNVENVMRDKDEEKYYIGKVIIDIANINPATYLGFGTWELFGQGKCLVGVDVNDTDFNTILKTGGEKKHTLTVSETPSHTHNFSATSGNQSANHTHSVGAHAHGLNSHTHSFSATSGEGGNHRHSPENGSTHGFQSYKRDDNNVSRFQVASGSAYHAVSSRVPDLDGVDYSTYTTYSGTHTHTVSGTSGAASGSTANSTAFNSGSNSANHTHTVSGTTGSSGTGDSHNNLQPYITVYFWKRVA